MAKRTSSIDIHKTIDAICDANGTVPHNMGLRSIDEAKKILAQVCKDSYIEPVYKKK